MMKGIRKQWKQSIYYGFVSAGKKSHNCSFIIEELIRKCMVAGLIVVATICDQGSNNCAALNYLVSRTRSKKLKNNQEMDISEFYFEVDGQTVIPLFDPPHLIKGIRNNLLEKNLIYYTDGIKKTARWSDLDMAYQMDLYLGSLRLFPNLTDDHIKPSASKKMKVSLCTQAINRTAVAINIMATTGHSVEIEGKIYNLENRAQDKYVYFFLNLVMISLVFVNN